MPNVFVIEDVLHSELCGEFATRSDALAELKRRSFLPWDTEPNLAPCTSWRTCGRIYEILEIDSSQMPEVILARNLVLEMSAEIIRWRHWDDGRQVLKRLYSADKNRELEIFRRTDGLFSYVGHEKITEADCSYWVPMETAGLFDSAEGAERSAREAIDWIERDTAKSRDEEH